MNTLVDTLLNRASHAPATLEEPAPTAEQLEQIVQCALSAPDHGKLRPWRFVAIDGESRRLLGEATATAAQAADASLSEQQLEAIRNKPFRSPLIVACVVDITHDHPKTPEFEQLLSAGAAIQQLQLAANDLGFGAIWLSGPHCNAAAVKQLLGAPEKDIVAGFIYLGSPTLPAPAKQRPLVAEHLSYLQP